jgi:hypothetical protein
MPLETILKGTELQKIKKAPSLKKARSAAMLPTQQGAW